MPSSGGTNVYFAIMMISGKGTTYWRHSEGGLTVNDLSNPGRTTHVSVGGTVYFRVKSGSWSGYSPLTLAYKNQTVNI